MPRFRYSLYLQNLLNRGGLSDTKQDAVLRELRLREDTWRTLLSITILSIIAVIAVVIAQWNLVPCMAANHIQTAQQNGHEELTRPDQAVSTETFTDKPESSSTSFLHTVPSTTNTSLLNTHAPVNPMTSIWLAVLWTIGIYNVGALMGFLFGIPRIAQAPPDTGDIKKKDKSAMLPNTNLEQISDWLTKIIVGVGLVESKEIAARIYSLAQTMSHPDCGVACVALSLAIIITFSVLGFFIGYLGTRMFLSPIFNLADGALGSPMLDAPTITNANVVHNTATAEDNPINNKIRHEALAVIQSTGTPNLNEPFENRYVRAKSLIVAGEFKQAALEYASLVAERPADIRLRRERLWALFKRGPQWSSEIAGVLKALDDLRLNATSSEAVDVYLSLTFHYLYAENEQAVKRIIELVKEYENRELQPATGLYINLACAYAQLNKIGTTTFEDSEKDVADAISRAVLLNPSSAAGIRKLLIPTNDDNDLSAFRNSTLVQNAIKSKPPAITK